MELREREGEGEEDRRWGGNRVKGKEGREREALEEEIEYKEKEE